MFLALWEFEVKPGSEKRFETVYGPDGDWAQLFHKDPNYFETRLLRDALRQNLYVTLDFWYSRATYENFLQAHQDAYKTLDSLCEGLTLSERRIGVFCAINE